MTSNPTGPKDGLKAAIAATGGALVAPETQPEQLALIPEPGGDAPPPMLAVRRAGRPAGALNKRTIETIRWVEVRYGSLIGAIAKEAYSTLDDLVEQLGCTKFEAADYRAKRREFLMPFLHQKLGNVVAADEGGGAAGHPVFIFEGPAPAGVTVRDQRALPAPDDEADE